ncbi:MAG: branched-chain amino acid ABC transporter permease [Burkholderiaceae bacterium]|jgi:branched-chain amino acid transport system permease protein|nr:branched-chain amino acid ABC transporter permease [Burkholderiaceae bacterium]MDH5208174.1 branched-chain amino acid ABC transporter permease [Burkholderiaceae bacterium]
MLYRENGQFKISYADDQQILPILQDRWFMLALLAFAYLGLPALASDYTLRALILPFLILAIAAIGLNILVGYCGQISLGTAAFMAVGAYAAYNIVIRAPVLNFIVVLFLAGGVAALVGVLFGIPSLRIKGLYLAVATLAAQFFVDWMFARVKWFTDYSPSGSVSTAPIEMFGWKVESPLDKYLLVLTLAVVLTLAAKNLVRGHIGRSWMAMRDMDVAAEVIGIRPLYAKLTAFAVSSFYAGVAGALWGFVHLGAWEPLAFNINLSLNLLFMIIIGGMGSLLGAYFGAAFIVLLPILLNQIPGWFGIPIDVALASHLELIIFGSLIVFFLIVEPHGLARLWAIGKEKLRLWPFPH